MALNVSNSWRGSGSPILGGLGEAELMSHINFAVEVPATKLDGVTSNPTTGSGVELLIGSGGNTGGSTKGIFIGQSYQASTGSSFYAFTVEEILNSNRIKVNVTSSNGAVSVAGPATRARIISTLSTKNAPGSSIFFNNNNNGRRFSLHAPTLFRLRLDITTNAVVNLNSTGESQQTLFLDSLGQSGGFGANRLSDLTVRALGFSHSKSTYIYRSKVILPDNYSGFQSGVDVVVSSILVKGDYLYSNFQDRIVRDSILVSVPRFHLGTNEGIHTWSDVLLDTLPNGNIFTNNGEGERIIFCIGTTPSSTNIANANFNISGNIYGVAGRSHSVFVKFNRFAGNPTIQQVQDITGVTLLGGAGNTRNPGDSFRAILFNAGGSTKSPSRGTFEELDAILRYYSNGDYGAIELQASDVPYIDVGIFYPSPKVDSISTNEVLGRKIRFSVSDSTVDDHMPLAGLSNNAFTSLAVENNLSSAPDGSKVLGSYTGNEEGDLKTGVISFPVITKVTTLEAVWGEDYALRAPLGLGTPASTTGGQPTAGRANVLQYQDPAFNWDKSFFTEEASFSHGDTFVTIPGDQRSNILQGMQAASSADFAIPVNTTVSNVEYDTIDNPGVTTVTLNQATQGNNPDNLNPFDPNLLGITHPMIFYWPNKNPNRLTFRARYSNTEFSRDDLPGGGVPEWKTFAYTKTYHIQVDADGYGNGHPDFNPSTAQPVYAKHIQFWFYLTNKYTY